MATRETQLGGSSMKSASWHVGRPPVKSHSCGPATARGWVTELRQLCRPPLGQAPGRGVGGKCYFGQLSLPSGSVENGQGTLGGPRARTRLSATPRGERQGREGRRCRLGFRAAPCSREAPRISGITLTRCIRETRASCYLATPPPVA